MEFLSCLNWNKKVRYTVLSSFPVAGRERLYALRYISVCCHFQRSCHSTIITNSLKVVFDGAMVVLAIYTTNIVHPGVYLPRKNQKSTMSMEKLSGAGYA